MRRAEFATRAATFEELLGSGFRTSGDDGDASGADDGLAAWCRSSSDGRWPLFERRLGRDGWDLETVRRRFATAQPCATDAFAWAADADWIRAALTIRTPAGAGGAFPFSDLFVPVADEALSRLGPALPGTAVLAESARRDLRERLMADLTGLCAAALYDRFTEHPGGYRSFIATVDTDGLFAERPVLLRLTATLVRQWLDATAEFVARLSTDIDALRGLAGAAPDAAVIAVGGGLSDRHDGGRSVLAVTFDDGGRCLYKPRDQRLAAACAELLDWLGGQAPPAVLRVPRTISRDGYGWTEFIEHTGCADDDGVSRYFRRAGAWLALLYALGAADVHHENVIAAADHPVPVDLECLLQEEDPHPARGAAYAAHDRARSMIADSVLSVGLLPGYARVGDREMRSIGGMAAGWAQQTEIRWRHINSDDMSPEAAVICVDPTNLPHIAGEYGRLDAHLPEFLSGFTDYARFLGTRDWSRSLDGFAGLAVRKVLRPTQYYHLLLTRLRDDRTMSDGLTWSVQADFVARLADWNTEDDPRWPLVAAQRDALLELSVPIFSAPSDPGLARVHTRLAGLDEATIARQIELIGQTSSFLTPPQTTLSVAADGSADGQPAAAADRIAQQLADYAVRAGTGAAWTGLTWFPDSDSSQLSVLGNDLYNGNGGIAVFLAAYARCRSDPAAAGLSRAALAVVRADLHGANAFRSARLIGVGGATGLGSIVYSLAVTAALLDDDSLRTDAHRAAELISDRLIAADNRYDVIAGGAGAILGLLRLYRDCGDASVLAKAVACGEHLLQNSPASSWTADGMSHGATGAAYAMTALAAASGRDEFDRAAAEYAAVGGDGCCAGGQASSQWCHGAAGIGLAHLGMQRHCPGAATGTVEHALGHVLTDWPARVDTLCCGSLGNIEFLRAAGRPGLAARRLSEVLASARATGGYRWNGGDTRFNVGLFRGLAGVGYTCLRGIDPTLPNVLLWE